MAALLRALLRMTPQWTHERILRLQGYGPLIIAELPHFSNPSLVRLEDGRTFLVAVAETPKDSTRFSNNVRLPYTRRDAALSSQSTVDL